MDRQPGGLPGADSADEVDRLDSSALEEAGRGCRPLTMAAEHDRLVGVRRASRDDVAELDVHGVGDTCRIELCGLADVDQRCAARDATTGSSCVGLLGALCSEVGGGPRVDAAVDPAEDSVVADPSRQPNCG